jgi:hypothetical protein
MLDGRVVVSASRLPQWLVRLMPESIMILSDEELQRLADERGRVDFLSAVESEEHDCCIAISMCMSYASGKPRVDSEFPPNPAAPIIDTCIPYRFEVSRVGNEWLTPEE